MTMSYATTGTSTPALGLVRLVAAVFAQLGRVPRWMLDLAFRVGIASVFFKSGLTKIASWEFTIQLFADEYKVPLLSPEVAAYLGTAAELICPVLLVLGLGTRFAAAALLGMTFVIQVFVYPESWSEHLIWASILGYLLTRGPGPVSLDRYVGRALQGR